MYVNVDSYLKKYRKTLSRKTQRSLSFIKVSFTLKHRLRGVEGEIHSVVKD